jgi:hypothetical protein
MTKLLELEGFELLYRAYRSAGETVRDAAASSIKDWALGNNAFSVARRHSIPSIGTTDPKTKLFWVDSPEMFGFRFVGWADTLFSSRNVGYYTNEHGDHGYRGVVYLLPKRRGFVVGYASYEPWSKGSANKSAPSDGVRLHRIYEAHDKNCNWGNAQDGWCSCVEDAAEQADGITEKEAEKEYEYNRAYDEGCRAGSTLDNARDQLKEKIEDLRPHKNDDCYPDKKLCSFTYAWDEYRSAFRAWHKALDYASEFGISERDLTW